MVFFTILYWLLVYILIFKKKLIFKELSIGAIALIAAVNLVLILLARPLLPVFEFVLKITGKIGNLIFGLITTIVFFLILTPIALFKKSTGQRLMYYRFDKEKETYFEEWEPSENLEKQY